MTKISIINLKGGASKTSIIVNLGGVLVEHGRKPMLIDLDPQKSATRWASQEEGKFPYPVIAMEVKNPKEFKNEMDRLEAKHTPSIVLFDTPPALQAESMIAALLSDIVLIPITPSPLDLWAAEKALSTVKEARKERAGLKIVLIPSRLMPNTVLGKEMRATLQGYGELISPAITLRIAMAETPIQGKTINTYAPKSASHREFLDLMKFLHSHIPIF